MAEYNVMTTKTIINLKTGDKIYAYEGYGVKKIGIQTTSGICSINAMRADTNFKVMEFPQLGKSLPCVFDVIWSTLTEDSSLYVIVMEYGGQPDPKYFDIIGLDETGEPIYQEEEVTT